MRWDRNYSSSELDDRRGESFSGGGGFGGGGAGLFGLIRLFSLFGWKGIIVGLIIAGFVGLGGQCLGGSETSDQHQSRSTQVQSSAQENELVHFVGFVFDDVQNTWRKQIPGYDDSRVVLFRRGIRSGCGTATTAVGPFYCPVDKKVYLDLSFYDELRSRFGAPGDFAEAYVIAHEVGHHVQDLKGLLGGQGRDNSIHTELQADCLAGAWAKDANARGLLEMGDLDEALNAASQIGDDTLQRKSQGYVQPETWTHGSSAERKANFQKGFDGGAAACGI
jgi:hypothetical protein